jgi:signal transduction histidine kinase
MSQKPIKPAGRLARIGITRATIFKLFLLLGLLAVSFVFIWYTFSVIEQLKEDRRQQVEKYVRLWQLAANSPTTSGETMFIFEEIIVKASFPILVLNGDRDPIHWRNIEGIESSDTSRAAMVRLREIAADMVATNGEYPLYFGDTYVNYFCYGDSKIIRQLTLMPFIEIAIVLAFMIISAVGFHNIRRSEERHIWVGMAKETAHQLGTPISSLLGWLEVLDSENKERPEDDEFGAMVSETIDNMHVDVKRLRRVANRFGLIGSVPDLTATDLSVVLSETVDYFRRRLPFEGKGIQIEYDRVALPDVMLNDVLFGWALENILKNALQVVDSREGVVTLTTEADPARGMVTLEIVDNGPGVSQAVARKIFQPGVTTNKRGWGLGLTLARRIIDEYHGGRILLKKSRPGETVFSISLPFAEK